MVELHSLEGQRDDQWPRECEIITRTALDPDRGSPLTQP